MEQASDKNFSLKPALITYLVQLSFVFSDSLYLYSLGSLDTIVYVLIIIYMYVFLDLIINS